MLKIKQLNVQVQDQQQSLKTILSGLNLEIGFHEVHAIMGPNGSGKSTLAHILAGGHDAYHITQGSITLDTDDLLKLTPEEHALRGIFLAFQHPVEIPGINNMYFLRVALNSLRVQKRLAPIDAIDFLELIREKSKAVGLPESFLQRAVNEGFSGGEKKRNEILQALILEPRFMILDEIDSGLDVDALQAIAKCVNALRHPQRSILMITHYQRLLDYIPPDRVHIMMHGCIVQSGDGALAKKVEEQGYHALSIKESA